MNKGFSKILEADYDEIYLFSKTTIFIYIVTYYMDYKDDSSNSSDKDLKIFFEDFIKKYRTYLEETNINNLKNVFISYFLLSPIVMNKVYEKDKELSNCFKELNDKLSYTTQVLENSINIRKNIDKIKEINNNINTLRNGLNEKLQDVKSNDIIILMEDEYNLKILKYKKEINKLLEQIDILQTNSNMIQNNNILVN